jgi:predicted DNA-binding WGR domain protein
MVLVDPAPRPRPRARWYALSLEPTLFGGVDLVRRWGRLGTRAQRPARRAEHYPDAAAALAGLERALAHRVRRGYAPPSMPPADGTMRCPRSDHPAPHEALDQAGLWLIALGCLRARL